MIDPSIPLQVRPPAPPADPMQQYAAIQQIKGGQYENALRQTQVATAQLENQQRALSIKQQTDALQALTAHGGDVDAAAQDLISHGNPQGLILQKNHIEVKKSMMDLQQTEQKIQSDHVQHLGMIADHVLQMPAELQPMGYQVAKSMAEHYGYAKPGELPADWNPQTQQMIQQFRDTNISPVQRSEITKNTAQGSEANARANEVNTMLPGKQANQQLTNTELQQKTTGNVPITPYQKAQLGNEQKQIGLRTQEVGLRGKEVGVQMYNAGLGPNGQPMQYTDPQGNPVNVTPIAQKIANYELPPASARSYTTNRNLMNQVIAANPSFDISEYEKRQATAKQFSETSPQSAGGQVLALRTLIHHSDFYQQVASALNNGSFKPGNAAFNAISDMMGRPAPNNAKLVAQFLAGETAKLAQGGAPFEAEVKNAASALGNSNSPDQIKQAGDTLLQIATGRGIPLQEKLQEARLSKNFRVIGDDEAGILQKNGYDPGTLKKSSSGSGSTGGLAVGQKVKLKNGNTVTVKTVHPDGSFDAE